MYLKRILKISSTLFFITLLNCITASEQHGRPYDNDRDIGFRWRTTLNINCRGILFNSDEEHIRLKRLVDSCDKTFTENNANVIAASFQVFFHDSVLPPVHIGAEVYTRDLPGIVEGTKTDCFTTACLTIEEDDNLRHPPITYRNRQTFDLSIPFIFNAIGMKDDSIKTLETNKFKYNYRDTEFQLIHELFSTQESKPVPRKRGLQKTNREPRFMKLFKSIIGERSIEDVSLIVIHIHTKFDPCSVCAEMLCNLSQTLNYLPENLIQDKQLCQQLKSHSTQFLIEVSSDKPYWNSREVGFDQFYAIQLGGINNLNIQPIEIIDKDNFPSQITPLTHPNIVSKVVETIFPFNYSPPFVIFKHMNPINALKCLKPQKNAETQTVTPILDEETQVSDSVQIMNEEK